MQVQTKHLLRVQLTVVSKVMLVDLARNDVNRVCDPLSTRVDRLMVVQKVRHLHRQPHYA